MIKNYVITGWRNITRHKLFAIINIAGLAVSMSVGLLIIALVSDLLSYDNFHEKANRTYRIVTTKSIHGLEPEHYASASAVTAKLIREAVAGAEEITVIRNGAGGDISSGSKTVSCSAFYADKYFLSVFDFELIHGNRTKALAEPYSIVLTEKASKRLFGNEEAMGRYVRLHETEYLVTGILAEIPHLSHLKFEGLVSFATAELTSESELNDWTEIYLSYVYVVLGDKAEPKDVQSNLSGISKSQLDSPLSQPTLTLSLQPLTEISLGRNVTNHNGPVMPPAAIWVLIGLGVIVITSSCFNYANLSIASSLRRFREIGVRKLSGASSYQVFVQFITESLIISLFALAISLLLFFLLRPEFLSLHSSIERIASLNLTLKTAICFFALAIAVGIVAGIVPAIFFAHLNLSNQIKGISPSRRGTQFGLRKLITVVQYVFSFAFITTTAIGYVQYRNFLSFELGFKTDDFLNIRVQGNEPDVIKNELLKLGEVDGVTQSLLVPALGHTYSEYVRYGDATDSALTWMNIVDENYLPLHEFKLISGRNFLPRASDNEVGEVIISELFASRLGIEPSKAVGEVIKAGGKDLAIIGVIQDFHYETVEDDIEPVVLRYSADIMNGFINAKIKTKDRHATMSKIEQLWKKVDKDHPLDAVWYDDQIKNSYSQYSMMIKVVSLLAVLSICIASSGLLGMVVFTAENRVKEIAIRKTLGAGETNLVTLLGKSFVLMLILAAFIAIPATYLFFNMMVLPNFAYHKPIGIIELVSSAVIVLVTALSMIVLQTLRTVRRNPAAVLRA